MPNFRFVRAALTLILPVYERISDTILGQDVVKEKGDVYLPRPNPADTSQENKTRYISYVLRAVFYNVTARTLAGLTGQVFARDPVVVIPEQLNPLIEDADGTGITLNQLAKRAMNKTIGFGRSGLFTDFPTTEETVTRQQQIDGDIRPTITCYSPQAIINWRTMKRGAKHILSLVVIQEVEDSSDIDDFEISQTNLWRVLRLDEEGLYVMDVYRDIADEATKKDFTLETFFPRDATGQRLTDLPFTFVGAQNNDPDIDESPLNDISILNIAHYRNSADYEESSYTVGQPTLVLGGLSQDWVDNVLKGEVQLGSRAVIMLPEGGTGELLQALPNTMPFEAMGHKEKQMVSLGAKLIDPKTVERTATEAGLDNTSEMSVLAASATNVSAGILFSLKKAALFAGGDQDSIQFKLSTDFAATSMTAQERAQLVFEWQSGAISFPELRENLRKSGITNMDDDEAEALIVNEMEKRQKLQIAAQSRPGQPEPNRPDNVGNRD